MTTGQPLDPFPPVPSRNALRVLRRLALAGSTVGSFCTVAAITYDVHRRVSVAERIVENKRALQTSAPRYDATSAAKRLSRMMEAAEAGEFQGLDAWREDEKKPRHPQYDTNHNDLNATPMPTAESAATASFTSSTLPLFEATKFESKHNIPKLSARSNLNLPQPTLAAVARDKYVIHGTNLDRHDFISNANLDIPPYEQALTDNIRWHIEHRRLIDAAQIFLDGHPVSIQGISSERRELVVQLFYSNCQRGNVFIARSVFDRLRTIDQVSPGMWQILIVALARKGCVESAAAVYELCKDRFEVPHFMVDVVLRCLIESHRLSAAKSLLMKNLLVDRNCGISGAYLTGLWRKTRNIMLLNGQFKKLVMMFRRLDKDITEKLFNPVLKAYIDLGKFSDAEALVHDMATTYRAPLGCRTKGLLAYGKALMGDWPAVEAGLQEMRELGLTKNSDFTHIFDRIFLEYWPTHTGPMIQEFLYRHIEMFDIVPDTVLYKHILEAIIEKGDEDMLSEFVSMARQRGWEVTFDEHDFLSMLRRRQNELRDSPVGFWQMLRAAREYHGRAATSRHLLGYDHDSDLRQETTKTSPDELKFPMQWYRSTLQELTQPTRPIDQFQKLHKQMYHYIHVGKAAEALESYNGAKTAGLKLKTLDFELAVIATMLEHGLGAAQELIEGDRFIIQDQPRLPIFFSQIKGMDLSSEVESIKLAIFRFYQLCWWNRGSIIKHHVSTSTSRRLIASNKPEMALDVLVAVYMSKYGRSTAFDGVCMKMFLRAFAAVDNLAGIRWCLLTAFARGTALNQDFIVEAHRVLGIIRRDLDSLSPEELMKEEPSKKQQQLHFLAYVNSRLTKKCAGTAYLDLKGLPKVKKSIRGNLKQPMHGSNEFKEPWKKFRHRIECWDEEYELERVLGRIQLDKETILATWVEQMPWDEED